VNLNDRDADDFVRKTKRVDRLDIDDPDNLSGFAGESGRFRLPFVTIESVIVLNESTIGVLNDNNEFIRNDPVPSGVCFLIRERGADCCRRFQSAARWPLFLAVWVDKRAGKHYNFRRWTNR
jgi:hypothetical protein